MAELDVLVLGDGNPDLVLRGDFDPVFGQAERLVDHDLVLGGSGARAAGGGAGPRAGGARGGGWLPGGGGPPRPPRPPPGSSCPGWAPRRSSHRPARSRTC